MFKTIQYGVSAIFWVSLACSHSGQNLFNNGSLPIGFNNETDVCTEMIRLSKVVGWKTIIGYTLDGNTNHNLSLCGVSSEDSGCCPIRSILSSSMNEQFNQSFTEKLFSISTVFSLSYKLFNFSFLNLLNHTKFELHYYFISSNEQQFDDSSFFSDLFWDMDEYFVHNSGNLADSFLAFFDNLIKQLLSFHYNDFNLEESTFDCISKLARDIKPFGDVPTMLGNQMKKSFQLVRTFAHSLKQGQEILNLLEKIITPTLSCTVPIEELSYCSYCSELDRNIQCSNTSCTNLVLNHCLKGLKIFEKEWLQYVDSLLSVMECFDQYCNLENVVRTIEENIMEAIGTFQKTAKQFFNEVENKCKVLPQNYRDKRSSSGLKSTPPPFHPSQMLMEKLKNIKVDIESRRDFINSLVSDACHNFLNPVFPDHSQEFNCSNVVNILEQKTNVTSIISTNKKSQFVQLSLKVKNISERMRSVLSSYRAFASEKIDATSSGFVIYSSGSGDDDDGSDDEEDDNDDNEDDDEDGDRDGVISRNDNKLPEEFQGKIGKGSEDDITFEKLPSSCGLKHCYVLFLWLFILTALFFP